MAKKIRSYTYNCPNVTRIDARKCCSHHISLEILQEIIKESLKKEWLLSNIKTRTDRIYKESI